MYIRPEDVLSPRDKVRNLEVYLEKFLEKKREWFEKWNKIILKKIKKI